MSSGLSILPVAGRPAAPLALGTAVDAIKRGYEIRHQRTESPIERRASRDQNIVEIGSGMVVLHVSDGRLETPADAIALDGLADLPGDSEAEPGPRRCPLALTIGTRLGLEHEGGRRPTRAFADALEFRPRLERDEPWARSARSWRRLAH